MATAEEKLINSVCENKDIAVLMDANVDDLFVGYGDVWESLKSYYAKFRSVPDISILQERHSDLEKIEVGGDSRYYLESLKNEYMENRIGRILEVASSKHKHESAARLLEQLQTQLSKLNKYTNSVRDLDLTDIEAAEAHFQKVRERAELMGGSPGIPTGIQFIDSAYVTGQAPGHLIVTIGWPGKAKTWFTSYLACQAFAQGFKPMIFSLEMTPENMRDRIYTIMGSGLFSASGFSRGDVDIDNFRTWSKKHFDGKKGFVVVSNDGLNDVTPNVIQGKIEQHRPDMVILDYAQLLSDNRKSDAMTPRMMNLSREIKNLAVTNEIPVNLITAATAEESSDRDDPPTLNKVAWSKAIEYDADMAYAVQRHDDSNLVEIVGRKNRHGDLFAGFLDWDIDRGIIEEKFDI